MSDTNNEIQNEELETPQASEENQIEEPQVEDNSEVTEEIVEEELKNDVLVIKCKFKFQGSGIFGVFAVLLNNDVDYDDEDGPFISLNVIVSYFSDVFQMDLKENWSSLETKFNDIQIKGDFASTLTNNFRRSLANAFSNSDIGYEIVTDFKKNKLYAIEQEIDRILSQTHKDRSMDMEVFFEEANGKSITSIRKSRIELETPLTNEDALDTPMIGINPLKFSIPANPVLAPVGEGIASNQLSPGVRILMKIDGSTTYGQQWIDNFGLYDTKTKTYKPIVGIVDQVGPVIKNNLDIVVKYQENQYTKFNVESGVKIKLFNPSQIEDFFDPLANHTEFTSRSVKTIGQLIAEDSFIYLLVAGVVVLVLAIITWLVMS